VRLAGATAVPVRLQAPGFALDEAALAAAFSPRTKALIYNSPHNPTGHVATAAECAGPELERFIRARVCGEPVEPPASIAARVAWCVAQREVAHLFGASYCAGRDAGADR
jgi:bifunctional pyridoxal-dependent enzyme with beta-cystathionase and maltose regulon repressor activities